MRLYHFIMNLLFPPRCVLCRRLLEKQETDLCRSCRMEAPSYPHRKRKIQFLDSFAAVWYYEGTVRASLLRYKFRGARGYARCYGRILAMKLLEAEPDGFDLITWVPVSRLRKFRRGYDQVALLAQAVGQELGMEPEPVLKKIRHNPQQSRIRSEAARRANVLGVYRVENPELVRGRRILLLDDILTTGATASECGKELRLAQAKEVHCAAVAAARKY